MDADTTKVLFRLIDKCASVFVAAIYGGTLVGIAYFIEQAIGHLAGHDTAVFLSYFMEVPSGITISVSLGTGVLGAVYGIWQRRLHQRTIANFAPRLAKYERLIDPDRSTSGLTSRGETHPDDL